MNIRNALYGYIVPLFFIGIAASTNAAGQAVLPSAPQALTSAIRPTPLIPSLPTHAIAGSARVEAFNARALASASLRFSIDGREIIVHRMQEVRSSNGAITWIGKVEGAPGGELAVTTGAADTVFGVLRLGIDTWEFKSTSTGRVVLYRINENLLPDEAEPIRTNAAQETAKSKMTGESSEIAISAGPIVQDILVVYTPAVVTALGGVSQVQTQIQWAIDSTNAAYIASQVNIRLNLVGTSQIEYTETGNISVALTRLQGMFDGFMDDVHALRNSLGADLVALLAQENECGNALMPGAFSVTAPKCISGYTFAHEVGHNQGADHDKPTTGSTSTTAYNFGYRTCDHPERAADQAFRTVLSYGCAGVPRVNYFSNPNVLYNGVAPMGISTTQDPTKAADNARVLNESATTTAAYRSAPVKLPLAPTSLTGNAVSATQINLAWKDNSSDEAGYYMERATVSEGIFAQVAQLAAGATSYAANGLSANTAYLFRVRAYNGSGNSTYSNTITVTTASSPPPPVAPAPANISVSTRSVTIRWANVTGETGYDIVREQQKNGRWSVASTASVSAEITSLTQSLNSGTYRYVVRARNASGVSPVANATCSGQTGCNTDGWTFVFTRR